MIRKTLLVISLVLLVGTVGLWVRSYQRGMDVLVINERSCKATLLLSHGSLQFSFGGHPAFAVVEYMASPVVIEHATVAHTGYYCLAPQVAFAAGSPTIISLPLWTVAASFLVCLLITFVPNLVRFHYRRRHNLCLTCGYDLTGNVSGRCSECGTAIEKPESKP